MRIQEVWNSDEIKKYFMSKENYILVNGEELLGFFSIEREQDSIFIHTVQIVPEYQNKMAGYYALKWLVRLAMNNEVEFLRCGVFDSNPIAQVYRRIGFEKMSSKNGIYQMEFSLTCESVSPLMQRMV